ncbi:hypothetical protein G6734_02700 [Polynucleobacter paneuropaeus]|nr:hypothetical protein [Polynucleobacter paneuropaeus]
MFKEKKVGSLVSESTKGITPKYVSSSNLMVLNQKCIRNNRIDFSLAQFCEDPGNLSEKKLLRPGDILLNSTGVGTAGRVAFVNQIPDGLKLIADSHILLLRCKTRYEAQCLGYLLYSYEKEIQSFMDGSTGQSELDKVRLFNIQLTMPNDAATQESVAKFLHLLDQKIDANTTLISKMDSILEQMYRFWFYQFGIGSDEKMVSKLIKNDALKKDIPFDWEVRKLSEITEIATATVDTQSSNVDVWRHYSIPSFDEFGTYQLEAKDEIKSNKFKVEKTDILVSKLNPWFNRVIYAEDLENLICSTEFVVWRAPSLSIKNFLYMLAKDPHFIKYCSQSSTGTSNSHKRINPTLMMKYKIPFHAETIEKFGLLINPMIQKKMKLELQNKELARFRSLILPMLMSGQIVVH